MADLWTSELPWADHQQGLARWAARRWGWNPGDPDWPSALALLVCAEDEGHTAFDWAGAEALWSRRFSAVEPVPSFDLPPPHQWPARLWEEGWLIRRSPSEKDLVQTARNAALEARLAQTLTQLAQGAEGASVGRGQEEAVRRAAQTRLLLLVGGPGTGKTTTLKRLVDRWRQLVPDLRTVVAAPTGRAAARARESFGAVSGGPECLTLHRLLGLAPGIGTPWHGPHRPLPFDLVIVDEASMLDLRTAVALTDALSPTTALVLVGDPGQLPSVEPGAVLSSLLAWPALHACTVRLVDRFRLARDSAVLARVFDRLQEPPSDPDDLVDQLADWGSGQYPDFRWVITAETEDPGPQAVAAWGSARTLSVASLEHRVLLSPVHQGPGGTEALGILMDRSLGRTPGTIAEGLPWMISKNLPHLDLHNGDRGLLVRRDGTLWFETPEAPGRSWAFYLVSEDGGPAWAVTVHKSQGSEYDRVVVVLPPRDSPTLVRQLLYTGLTRARQSAVMVGSRASLRRALIRTAERQSGLS